MVTAAPIIHFGSMDFAGVVGPFLGEVFALGIAQGLSPIALLATVALENGGKERTPRTLTQIDAIAYDNLGDVRKIVAALAPVRQRAGATRIVLNLADAAGSVRLDIVDDGCGFDVPHETPPLNPSGVRWIWSAFDAARVRRTRRQFGRGE